MYIKSTFNLLYKTLYIHIYIYILYLYIVFGEKVDKLKPSSVGGGNVKSCRHFESQVGRFLTSKI